MSNPQKRPIRATKGLLVIELGLNSQAGPHGSLELAVSHPRMESPDYHYWPMDWQQTFSDPQLQDLLGTVGREVTDAVLLAHGVQMRLDVDR